MHTDQFTVTENIKAANHHIQSINSAFLHKKTNKTTHSSDVSVTQQAHPINNIDNGSPPLYNLSCNSLGITLAKNLPLPFVLLTHTVRWNHRGGGRT